MIRVNGLTCGSFDLIEAKWPSCGRPFPHGLSPCTMRLHPSRCGSGLRFVISRKRYDIGESIGLDRESFGVPPNTAGLSVS